MTPSWPEPEHGQGCFFGVTGGISGSFLDEGGYQYEFDLSTPSSCTSGLFDQGWTEEFGDAFIDYLFDPDAEDKMLSNMLYASTGYPLEQIRKMLKNTPDEILW